MKLKITGKIWKTGTGYVITIPRSLIESGTLEEGQELNLELITND